MVNEEVKSNIRKSLRIKILLLIVTIVLFVGMFPKGESLESEVTIGSVWIQEDLIATMTFEVLKDKETYLSEKQKAAKNVFMVFVHKDDEISKSIDSMESYNEWLLSEIDKTIRSRGQYSIANPLISPHSLEEIINIRKTENQFSSQSRITLNDIFRISTNALNRIYRKGYINVNLDDIKHDTLAVREGKFERLIPKDSFFDADGAVKEINEYLRIYFGERSELISAVAEYVTYFLIPTIEYSENLTNSAKEIAMDRISRNLGIVNENERIIAKHNRITPEVKQKIDSYRTARGELSGSWWRYWQSLGKFLHIVIVLAPIVIYIYLFRPKIYNDNLKILLICIIFLYIGFLTFLIQKLNVNSPVHFLIVLPMASMLLTIVFDSRVGFYSTIVLALIIAGLRGNDYVFAATNIIAGALGAYTVRDLRNRTQIFRSFFYILIGYLMGIIAFGLERFATWDQMLMDSAFAASNALISPVFTFGMIIFIEKAFKIITEFTLLELSDLNNPLLKNLLKYAPGTYTHSMTIGSLVENAAVKINANPLLARVGAYYHDIGKMTDPDAFTENQMDHKSKHEDLEPKESARLIIEHVKEGISLAERHKLPREIIDFIPMHHGKMTVSFFYAKAVEKYGKENVNIEDFRYPGPKPNSKETALLMLADACESAVRSIEDPDPKKIENMVDNLINNRVEEGQLANAPLTFSDLTKIKESFLSILQSQHHRRIKYPQQEELEKDNSRKEG